MRTKPRGRDALSDLRARVRPSLKVCVTCLHFKRVAGSGQYFQRLVALKESGESRATWDAIHALLTENYGYEYSQSALRLHYKSGHDA